MYTQPLGYYAASPQLLIIAMKKTQSQSTSNPTSVSQAAAQAAPEGDQLRVKDVINAFKRRHDYMVKALNNIEGIKYMTVNSIF